MEKHKNSKKMRKLRTTVIMCMLCVVLMTGTTYAWFTLSNTARVSNLSLKVASQGNLYINAGYTGGSDADPGTDVRFGLSEYVLKMGGTENAAGASIPELYPATTTDGSTFFKPIYSDSATISSLVATVETDAIKPESVSKVGYYYTETFYMYVDDKGQSTSYDITLEKKSTVTGTGGTTNAGTYLTVDSTTSKGAEAALRVSFVATPVDSTGAEQIAIYEPYRDISTTPAAGTIVNYGDGTYGNNAYGGNLISQNAEGKFISAGANKHTLANSPVEGDSNVLFTLAPNKVYEIKMYVWIEGTDSQCGNGIMSGTLQGNFKFIANKLSTTSTTTPTTTP